VTDVQLYGQFYVSVGKDCFLRVFIQESLAFVCSFDLKMPLYRLLTEANTGKILVLGLKTVFLLSF